MRAVSLRNLITEFGLITSLHANQIGVRKQERAENINNDIADLEQGIKTVVLDMIDTTYDEVSPTSYDSDDIKSKLYQKVGEL